MEEIIIFSLIVLLLISGCSQVQVDDSPEPPAEITDVTLTTSDNVNIASTFYPGSDNSKGVILLHMLSRDRKDWDVFAKKLSDAGFSVIAIDLRGHGDSDYSFKMFSPDEFNDMTKDVSAAFTYLGNKGITRVAVVGASIGANVALKYLALNDQVRTGILLSPGLDYRGVSIENINVNQPVLIVAAEDDAYSLKSSEQIAAGFNGELRTYEKAGHGTNMLKEKPELEGIMIDWISKRLV